MTTDYSNLEPIAVGRVQLKLTPIEAEAYDKARRSKTVLHYGCGPGYMTAAMIAQGIEAYGVDSDENAIAFCKRHVNGAYAAHFTSSLMELVGRTYQTVMSVNYLQRTGDPEATIARLWDFVEDGGQIVVTLPKDGRQFSPFDVHKFHYDDVVALAKTIAHPGDGTEYVVDLTQTEDAYIFQVRKEPLIIKYCQILANTVSVGVANDILSTGRFKTGVYNWSRVFNGITIRYEDLDRPQDFDVIHIQVAGDNWDAPALLRYRLGPKGESKTKIVVNLDYGPEYWWGYPPYPDLMLRHFQDADFVFSQNEITATILSDALGFAVPFLPHPVDTESLKALCVPVPQRNTKAAMIVAHRDNNVYMPWWVLRGFEFQTHLIGYMKPNLGGDVRNFTDRFYSTTREHMSGEDTIKLMSEMWVAVDLYTHHVQGRTTMELAGLGVPCLGYRNVDAQARCFPDMTANYGDIVRLRRILARLVGDTEFYAKTAEKARTEVEFYNYERSKERFLRMIGYDSGNGRARGKADVRTPAVERFLTA